jgi:hypothetical protein
MVKTSIKDFEIELKKLDERISIVSNKNRPGLANIKIAGEDICPIPDGFIQDEATADYKYEFPNGMVVPHRTKQAALDAVNNTLTFIQSKEGADLFFNKD